jgi:hypothetical protein
MWFWLTVLVGLLFTAVGVKIGFFEIFAAFFNSLTAIFVALFLTPFLLQIVPQAADFPGGIIFTTLAVGAGTFALLFTLCHFLITGQFTVPFPKVFDVMVAGALGFALGVLIVSFLLVLLSGTAIPVLGDLTVEDALAPNVGYLCWWNDGMHRIVSKSNLPAEKPTWQAITHLLDLAVSEHNTPPPAEPNLSPPSAESGE